VTRLKPGLVQARVLAKAHQMLHSMKRGQLPSAAMHLLRALWDLSAKHRFSTLPQVFSSSRPMPRRLPSLNALNAFEAAARYESFTCAAEELCVTQGAVSHQVTALALELVSSSSTANGKA
jgi:hypothetical protein